jgi:hypothetical protein
MNTYPFALIRAVPDLRRGETVNIGLVVFLPDRVDVRLLASLHKLRAIDPRVDIRALESLPDDMRAACQHAADVETRHALLSGMATVTMSDLGYFRCLAQDYEEEVSAIERDLVSPPVKPRQQSPGSRLVQTMKTQFTQMRLLASQVGEVDQHKVVAHFPVSAEQNLYADFVIRNSVWHVTETLDLRVRPESVRSTKFKQACEKAITLDQADKHLKGGLSPLVVIAADDATLELAQPHINMLSGYTDHIYNYMDRDERAAYFERIEAAAGLITVQ